MEVERNSKKPCSTRQLTLQSTIEKSTKCPHNSAKRSSTDTALVNMITKHMQPSSIVDDEGFVQLVHQLDPSRGH